MTTITLASKIDAILGDGSTYKSIAERAGCDASTIFRIRSGGITNPSYSIGVAIDAMHRGIQPPEADCGAQSESGSGHLREDSAA